MIHWPRYLGGMKGLISKRSKDRIRGGATVDINPYIVLTLKSSYSGLPRSAIIRPA